MARSIALAASLILAALLAWFQELPPRAKHDDAAPQLFAADRAMADLEIIARRPHPIGSPANALVRDHLVRRMEAMGLTPQIQTGQALEARDEPRGGLLVAGGGVENIIAVLPGRDHATPAVALMSHYDSVPGSPGAADDATGVAATLEIIRALKARGVPARDVIILITDGEEAGLLGARAFFREHPLARRIGFVVNMESRGGGGRVQMFQTGPMNGEAVALFQRSAIRPISSSLSVFLYEHMPNDTDFSISRDAGLPGLNYAFIGRQFDYHSPTSTPDNLQKRTLQDMGQQVLSATAAAAFAERLPAKAPDLVHAQTLLGGVIAYPPVLGWGLLALCAGLLALAVSRVRGTDAFAWKDVARGAGAAAYLLLAVATLLHLARRATGAEFGFIQQRYLTAQVSRYEIALILIGLGVIFYAASALARGKVRWSAAALPLGAGVLCSAFGAVDPIGLGLGLGAAVAGLLVYGRPAGTAGGWTGLILTGLAGGVALQAVAPTTAFLVTWPLLLACVSAAICNLGAVRGTLSTIAVAALAVVGLAWIGGFAHGLFLGLDMPELLAVTGWLAAFLLWPMIHPRIGGAGRITAPLVMGAGFVLIALVRLHAPWNDRFPEASMISYQVDARTGAGRLVSSTPDLPPWSKTALKLYGGPITTAPLPPMWLRDVNLAPAATIPLPGATLSLSTSAGRTTLDLSPPKGARVIVVQVRATVPVSDVTLNGLPAGVLRRAGEWSRIRWQGGDPKLSIAFTPSGAGQIEVRHSSVTESWPAQAKPLPARPSDVMAFDLSDSTVVTGEQRLTW